MSPMMLSTVPSKTGSRECPQAMIASSTSLTSAETETQAMSVRGSMISRTTVSLRVRMERIIAFSSSLMSPSSSPASITSWISASVTRFLPYRSLPRASISPCPLRPFSSSKGFAPPLLLVYFKSLPDRPEEPGHRHREQRAGQGAQDHLAGAVDAQQEPGVAHHDGQDETEQRDQRVLGVGRDAGGDGKGDGRVAAGDAALKRRAAAGQRLQDDDGDQHQDHRDHGDP